MQTRSTHLTRTGCNSEKVSSCILGPVTSCMHAHSLTHTRRKLLWIGIIIYKVSISPRKFHKSQSSVYSICLEPFFHYHLFPGLVLMHYTSVLSGTYYYISIKCALQMKVLLSPFPHRSFTLCQSQGRSDSSPSSCRGLST